MERQNLIDFEDADKFRSIVIAEIESSGWLITALALAREEEETWLLF